MEEKQVIIKSHLITYYFSGAAPEGAETILFLHGWRSESKIWFSLINSLPQEKFLKLAMDFPGFGKSEVPKTAFHIQDYAEIARELIEKLALTNVILVGHSIGGSVAIKIASENPKFLQKLVLVNSAGLRRKTTGIKIINLLAAVVRPLFRLPILRKLRIKIYKWIGAEDYVATPQLKQTFLNIINEDLESLLPNIKAPTLLLWGGKDEETPILSARIMEAKIPQSKLIIFPRAGHFSFLDAPQEFCKALIEFIQS